MPLARIIVFVVLSHSAFGAARVTASLYALARGASAFTVGVLMALFALVPMLLAMRAGRWLDAVGPWKPLATGTALMGAGVLLPAAFPYEVADIGPLLVACALVGTGFMLLQMTVQQIVGDQAAPGERPAAFSVLALGFSTSSLIGPIASGVLIDTLGHRAAFGATFVALAAAATLLALDRQRLPPRHAPAATGNDRPMFDLLRHRGIRNVLIASGLVSMAWDLQTFMIPVYGTRIGLAASEIGLVLGSFAAATFAIRLAMPRIARSYHEWQVLTFTLFTGSVAFALIPLLQRLLPLAAAMFLLGLGLGAAQPNVMSLIHARAPVGRVGEALGLRTTIMNGSHVVLPLVFGAFGAVLGAAAVFWTMATLLGAGGTAAWRHLRANP
ncbi:MAG: MFS transporter [Burkholderiaceae bacterium]